MSGENATTLKLGTRRSLLALAQSGWVAREIERANPGTRVELVGIDTRGDKILDVPLSQVQGKEFFVAEIDDALRAGSVDLTVHSFKDLSLDRPAEFKLGAVPTREEPRDVIVFGPGIRARLRSGARLRVGTSSPRRLENIPRFLAQALPDPKGPVDFVEIRGNVNTRLARLRESEGSERHLDGVVLATAGLARLWRDDKARAEIAPLLAGARWMILPLRECAAASAQGALAVECRASDARTIACLAKIHDSVTLASVTRERELLQRWGGGCHQRFGATQVAHPAFPGGLLFIAGKAGAKNEAIDELRWAKPAPPKGAVRAWAGGDWRKSAISARPLAGAQAPLKGAFFIVHARALGDRRLADDARVWTSGSSSWFELARQGVWVEGSAESLGYEWIRPLLAEPMLQLPAEKAWTIMTHEEARSDWSGHPVEATYSVAELDYSAEAIQNLSQATHVYWSSGSQWQALKQHAPSGAAMACGAGRTWSVLKAQGVTATAFPSIEEWKKWLSIPT